MPRMVHQRAGVGFGKLTADDAFVDFDVKAGSKLYVTATGEKP